MPKPANNGRVSLPVQCDEIRLEKFLRRCRLGQLYMVYNDEDSILDQKHEKQIFWDLYFEDL